MLLLLGNRWRLVSLPPWKHKRFYSWFLEFLSNYFNEICQFSLHAWINVSLFSYKWLVCVTCFELAICRSQVAIWLLFLLVINFASLVLLWIDSLQFRIRLCIVWVQNCRCTITRCVIIGIVMSSCISTRCLWISIACSLITTVFMYSMTILPMWIVFVSRNFLHLFFCRTIS